MTDAAQLDTRRDLEGSMFDMELLLRSYDDLQPENTPPWLWTIQKAFDDLRAKLDAHLHATHVTPHA